MPRPTVLVFGKTPRPVAGKWYSVGVEAVTVENGYARALLRHVDVQLEGLTHMLERKLPLNPLGPFGALVRACGQNLTEEMKIDPRELIGRTVKAQFTATASGELENVAFASLNEEAIHGPE